MTHKHVIAAYRDLQLDRQDHKCADCSNQLHARVAIVYGRYVLCKTCARRRPLTASQSRHALVAELLEARGGQCGVHGVHKRWSLNEDFTDVICIRCVMSAAAHARVAGIRHDDAEAQDITAQSKFASITEEDEYRASHPELFDS